MFHKKSGNGLLELEIWGTNLLLHPYRAVYWPKHAILILTDLHLGKIQHFRNAGIYLPKHASFDNYERLSTLLLDFQPDTLLILGDLFHSAYNQDWVNFCELRNSFHDIKFELVPGNHDIVNPDLFIQNAVSIHDQGLMMDDFAFSHFPESSNTQYNIAGHLHPGIRLVGDGLQSMRLPAFYFGPNQGLLPSFGTFTGTSLIRPKRGDQVVVIADDTLVKIDTDN
jgi:uncharacterized protein